MERTLILVIVVSAVLAIGSLGAEAGKLRFRTAVPVV
jgi:hypothetical protein